MESMLSSKARKRYSIQFRLIVYHVRMVNIVVGVRCKMSLKHINEIVKNITLTIERNSINLLKEEMMRKKTQKLVNFLKSLGKMLVLMTLFRGG